MEIEGTLRGPRGPKKLEWEQMLNLFHLFVILFPLLTTFVHGSGKATFLKGRDVRPICKKNPDLLYSLINHCRTTANLSNHIFTES